MVDQEKLRKILGHLQYECDQLNASARLLSAWHSRKDELADGAWSAYVESFAIHTRNLIEFLHRKSKWASDVRAGDFVPGWNFDENFMQTHYERANKQVNHLTYNRIDYSPQEYGWPYVAIAAELREELLKLQQAASSQSPLKTLDLYRHTKPASVPSIHSASQPSPALPALHSVTAKTTGQTGTSVSTPGFQPHGKME